ncbi:TolC family protein, partial [Shewanella sp. A3A]|nr:TolC family protein [Shewanella ferrihydritica]
MDEYALQHRPALLSTYFETRISAADSRSALLKLFPCLKLSAGYFQDSNNSLRHQDWNNISTQVSWNLMNVCRISDER